MIILLFSHIIRAEDELLNIVINENLNVFPIQIIDEVDKKTKSNILDELILKIMSHRNIIKPSKIIW